VAQACGGWCEGILINRFIGLILALITVAVGQNLGAGRTGMAINRLKQEICRRRGLYRRVESVNGIGNGNLAPFVLQPGNAGPTQ
jgi:hypothetical protein